jgi:tRNA(Ile)-lysidine synthase
MTITRPADMDPVTAAVNEAIGWVSDETAAPIAVACSGGADSIALAHATMRVVGAGRVVVIHVDHQLSPGSSAVAEGVATWVRGQGATAIVRTVTVDDRGSIEAAARDARYVALAEIADELELSTIVVGHTARDQAETVLMRILRGTGPAGLAGIPRTRVVHEQRCGTLAQVAAVPAERSREEHAAEDAPRILRPLLSVGREQIDAYVAKHSLPTWSDPMNADRSLFRVRVRDEILPALRRENPLLDQALVRLAASTREWLEVIDGLAAPFATSLACAELAAQPAAVRKRAIALALERAGVGYDAIHLDNIDELVGRPVAGQVAIDLPEARVVRTYDTLAIEPAGSTRHEVADLLPPEGYSLRRWQPGDRMRPPRLQGRSRKLSDLFIDAKIPRDVRSHARVVVRADGVIVWAEHLGLAYGEAENVTPRQPE